MKTRLMFVLLDLVGVLSFGRLRGELSSVPYAWRLLDRMEFICTQACFSDHSVSEGATESSIVCCQRGTCLWFHGEVSRGEWHESRDLMTSNGGLSPGGDKELT
jgi:hypothetical protein